MPSLYFGGSFNPIHHGHLRCAQAVAKQAGYDRVVLVPNSRSPHKPDTTDLASAADRLAMCRLAIDKREQRTGLPTDGVPAAVVPFEVSDIETRRAGPSFTIDTAQELRDSGVLVVNWLIGADMLLSLPAWHRSHELLRWVHFIIMARPGWELDWNLLPEKFRHLKEQVVIAPLIDISSTDVRRRVRHNLPIDDLVPASVARYIGEHGLYRA